jgi:AcrR family transcriptional regulator
MSETPLSDRRALRSTRALWQGLFALMQEKDWPDITVRMITDRADVARSTFYAHYQTKQDLLDAGFSLAGADIRAEVLSRPSRDGRLATLDWLIAHVGDSRGFLRRINGSAAGLLILNRFRRTTAGVLQAELARLGWPPDPSALAFMTGGVFAVIEHWLATGCPVPPDRLAATLSAQVLSQRPA